MQGLDTSCVYSTEICILMACFLSGACLLVPACTVQILLINTSINGFTRSDKLSHKLGTNVCISELRLFFCLQPIRVKYCFVFTRGLCLIIMKRSLH